MMTLNKPNSILLYLSTALITVPVQAQMDGASSFETYCAICHEPADDNQGANVLLAFSTEQDIQLRLEQIFSP